MRVAVTLNDPDRRERWLRPAASGAVFAGTALLAALTGDAAGTRQWARQTQVARIEAQAAARQARDIRPLLDRLTARQAVIAAVAADLPAVVPPPPIAELTVASPRPALLAALRTQDRYVAALSDIFAARTAAATAALAALGLDPGTMWRGGRGRGGPFADMPGGRALDGRVKALVRVAERWSILADNLAAVPSARPTDAMMVSSSYGVRSDPFTGGAAFHAGLDFVGSYGQPIRAAAPGRVAYVGERSGYGRVVELDHGNRIMTRYAHLSATKVRIGQRVARGDDIAAMGSTGRSTGTHLHFEVRVDGEPRNPRAFLSAGPAVANMAGDIAGG